MTWGMICNAFCVILLEDKSDLSGVNKFEEELCSEVDAAAYVGILKTENVLVLVTHCECTCRTGCKHLLSPCHSLAYASEVEFGLLCGLFLETVGNQCDTTAFLLLKEVHSIAHCIQYLYKILCEFRVVVVGIAAMEIADLLLECLLLLESVSLEPYLELLACVFRECSVMIHIKDRIHYSLDWFETESEVHDRSHCGRQCSHDVCICKDIVTKLRVVLAVIESCVLDDVADLHI